MKRLALALAALLLAAAPAAATPSLKGDVTVNAAIVTVGDMFDNAGALSETAIFRAPAPGTTGIVPLADVTSAARLIGLTDFDNVGYTRVRVVRAATTVDAGLLGGLVSHTLADRGITGPNVTADIHFDTTTIDIKAEQSDTPAQLLDLTYQPETTRFSARFMVAGIDQPVDLAGAVQLMTTAPRLLSPMPAGTFLTAADFEMAPVPLSTASAGGLADLDQLVGRQLLRPARAGLMLKATDVAAPTVVQRNAVVTVLLSAGPMTLTVKGQALTAAAAGEPVDVFNNVTHKILHGTARADGSVVINASGIVPPVTTTASL